MSERIARISNLSEQIQRLFLHLERPPLESDSFQSFGVGEVEKKALFEFASTKYNIPPISSHRAKQLTHFGQLYEYILDEQRLLSRKATPSPRSFLAPIENPPTLPTGSSTYHGRRHSGTLSIPGSRLYSSKYRKLSPEEEKRLMKSCEVDFLKDGTFYFLVDIQWWNKWKSQVMYEGNLKVVEPLDQVDNMLLFQKDGTLKPGLREDTHFKVITEEMWNYLVEWYGGRQPIKRFTGLFHLISSRKAVAWPTLKTVSVEVYPLTLRIVHSSIPHPWIEMQFSRTTLISEFKDQVCKKLGLDSNRTRIYQGTKEEILHMEGKLHPYLTNDCKVIFEEENRSTSKEDSPASSPLISRARSSPRRISSQSPNGEVFSTSTHTNGLSSPGKPKGRGLTGLVNLGNTCFMNSALQCLSNSALATYFLEDAYKNDLNRTNPLGMKGQIAEAFGSLMKELWSGSSPCVAPEISKIPSVRPFPSSPLTLQGKYAPQFLGFAQHDSQELLAFLLDGLHEDLNRVNEPKPYVELKESDGRPDPWVALEAWENHLKRNDSIIVDLFQGQYKSTLICPECKTVSVTFDPYMYLSLPLPVNEERLLKIILVDAEGNPVQYGLHLSKLSTVKHLKERLAELSGVKFNNLMVTEVWAHKFHKWFLDDEPVSKIQPEDELFAYEVLKFDHGVTAPVMQVGQGWRMNPQLMYQVGYPFLIQVHRVASFEEISQAIGKRLRRWVEEKEEYGSSFEMKIVSGSTTLTTLEPSKTCEIKPKQYFAIDWKSSVYDSQDAKTKHVEIHESCKKGDKMPLLSLQDCLRLWAAEEVLSDGDPWYCGTCQEHRQAAKKLDLWKLPKILVIHLKRFRYTDRIVREKIDTAVDFPVTGLDLTKMVQGPQDEPPWYDLFAVSVTCWGRGSSHLAQNHRGGLGGGHYTAHCKNSQLNQWLLFDDSIVSEKEIHCVKSRDAYVLFYHRRAKATL